MVLLPSEKARLVLGYLREQECYRAYKEFLISSPHLKELRGMIRKGAQPHEYEWKMRGLSNILDEYSSVECSICALQNSDVSKFFGDANTIAKKVQRLVEILQKQSAALSTSSKRDIKEFNNESHKPSHSTKNINKLKSVEGPNLPNTSLIVQDGIPIISNIPESVMSDESSDLCSLAFSPVKNDKTVIGNDNDRNISNLTMGNLDSFVRGNACRRIKMKNDSKKQAIRNNSKSKIEKTATGCTNEGFDMTLMTETILERTDIHEKIAENINKLYLSSMTKNEEKNSKTSETPSKVVENVNEKISDMEIVDLETHLNNVIRDIVNATEKDHVFDELLNDLVLKVAEEAPSSTSSEDTSPGRPTTSTPEHASGKSKIAVLNTTTSPVRTATESCKSTNKDDQESEKNNKNTTDDSIKNRLRSKLKVDNEDITNNTKSSSSTSTVMEVDKTPLKSSKPIDLLAMAINDADVSGSLRKMNVSNSKNDNKIVILSNEVVHRNLSDFNIANTCNSTVIQTKPANTLNFESTNSMNTHYILPAVNTNNMFLNTNMPQYLVTGNTEDDQNKVYLINTPLSLPIQNNGNNESNDVMAVPTFIVLPQSAPVTSAVKDNSTIGYQQVPKSTKKPKAVILPQLEQCKSQHKQTVDAKPFTEIVLINESPLQNVSLPKLSVTIDENKIESTIKSNSVKPIAPAVPKNLLVPQCSTDDNKKKSIEISASKSIDVVERDTPDLTTVQIKQRTSLSTPRRTKSHVRVLDFNTPPKMNYSRKAATSPKSGFVRISPKTVQKATKSNDVKEPIRSALFRSPKSKCTFILEEPEETEQINISLKSNKISRSPAIKLNGAWDSVQGLDLIVGRSKQTQKNADHSLETSQSSTLKSECESNESELASKFSMNSDSTITSKDKDVKAAHKDTRDNEKYQYKSTIFKKKNIKPQTTQKNKWDSDLRSMVLQTPATVRCTRLMSKKIKNNGTEKNIQKSPKKLEKTNKKTDMSDKTKKKSITSNENYLPTEKTTQESLPTIDDSLDLGRKDIEIKDDKNCTATDVSKNSGCKITGNLDIESTKNQETDDQKSSNSNIVNKCKNDSENIQNNTIIGNDSNHEEKQEIKQIAVEAKHESENLIENSSGENNKFESNILFKNIEKVQENTTIKSVEKNNDVFQLNDRGSDIIKGLDLKSTTKSKEEIPKNNTDFINIQDESAVFMTNDNITEVKLSDKDQLTGNSTNQINSKTATSGFINYEDMDNSRQRCELKPINSDQNSSDAIHLLETPFKLIDGLVPKTPRFVNISQVEDTPISKIKHNTDNNSLAKCGIPTPNFPLTPSASASSTPDVKNLDQEKEANEKNGLNSYYKPDQSNEVNTHKQKVNNESAVVPESTKTADEKIHDTTNNDSDDMDISTNSSSSSSSSSSSDSDSSSNTSNSSEDSILSIASEVQSNQIEAPVNKKDNQLPQKASEIKSSQAQNESSNIQHFIEKQTCPPQITAPTNYSKANEKLLQELDEKRLRILNKVKADLALKNTRPIKNKTKLGNIRKTNNAIAAKPKIKINVTRDNGGKFSSKTKLDNPRTSSNKNRRKSDSPRKRCLPENKPPNLDTNNLNKNEKHCKLEENLDTSFPILHISDDESECGNLDYIQKKKDIYEKSTKTSNDSDNTKEIPIVENDTPKQETVESIKIKENNLKPLDEPVVSKPEDQKNSENVSITVDSSPIIDGKIINKEVSEKETVENKNKDSHADVELKEDASSNNKEESSDDECSFEFSVLENTIYEECFEDDNLRKNNQMEKNDGFDINNFRVNVGDEGVLTITPLATLLDIPPATSKKLIEKVQKSATETKQKEINHKKRRRKTPLNILFETTVPKDQGESKHSSSQEKIEIRTTPCANLYEDSPIKGRYEQKKETKKAEKSNESSKRSRDDDHKSASKKTNHKERIRHETSSSRDEKHSKRKRTDEADKVHHKRPKPCNPQLIKDFDVDKVLDVIHGKK